MKINVENEVKLDAYLASLNGKATAHTFNDSFDVARALRPAEQQLTGLLSKRMYRGARLVLTSSPESMAGAYSYARKVTRLVLERGATGWFVIDGEDWELYPNQSGGHKLMLTEQQADVAVAAFKSKFEVIKP